jgi:hypothetical protein
MGYVEFEGEWISQMEYYHILGDRDIEKTFGYPMTITDSTHFTMRSSHPEERHNELLDYCELEYEHFIRTFEPDPTEHRMIAYYPIPVYILNDIDDCVTFVESGYIKRYNPPKEDVESRRPETNFSIYFPRPLVVLSEGKHLVGADDRLTSQIGFMAHHIGHILIRRFKRGGKVPGWVEAGVAHYYEGLTNFHQTVSVCEFRGFEEIQKWIDEWGNFMQWKKKMVEKENLGPPLPTLTELFKLKIETIDSLQMAKAWSMTTFLIKNHRKDFVEFVRRSYAPYRGVKELSQEEAWKVAFPEITPEQMEDAWRTWIVEQPIAPSREDRLKLD